MRECVQSFNCRFIKFPSKIKLVNYLADTATKSKEIICFHSLMEVIINFSFKPLINQSVQISVSWCSPFAAQWNNLIQPYVLHCGLQIGFSVNTSLQMICLNFRMTLIFLDYVCNEYKSNLVQTKCWCSWVPILFVLEESIELLENLPNHVHFYLYIRSALAQMIEWLPYNWNISGLIPTVYMCQRFWWQDIDSPYFSNMFIGVSVKIKKCSIYRMHICNNDDNKIE